MPTSRPAPLDMSPATPRRIPKLAVRNRERSSEEVAANDASHSSEDSSNEAQRISPGPSVHLRSPSARASTEKRHLRRESTQSTAQSRGRQPSKRKSAGVFGFLALKEPSTSALEEFAEHEKKKAAQKGAKTAGAVLPGVSLQKLPEHVPKVNSKWDGLPDSTKHGNREQRNRERMADRFSRNSMISLASKRSGGSDEDERSPRRPFGSLSSRPISQDKNRDSVRGSDAGQVRSDSRNMMHPLHSRTAAHPALRDQQGSRHDLLHHSSPPLDLNLEPYSSSSPGVELPQIPELQDRDYSSATITSPEASPKTPALESFMTTAKSLDRSLPPRGLSEATIRPEASWADDSEEVIVNGAGPDVLGAPLAVPRPQPKTSTPSDEFSDVQDDVGDSRIHGACRDMSLGPGRVRNFSHVSEYSATPTSRLSSTSAVIAPVQSSTYSSVPRESARPTRTASNASGTRDAPMNPVRTPSDSGSAASNLSAQWRSPPKERLGLGPHVKTNDVLPWELYEPPVEERKASDQKAAAIYNQEPKRKRFSKLGRK